MGWWCVPGEHFLQCVEQWLSKLKGDDWRRNSDCVPFLHAAIQSNPKSWLAQELTLLCSNVVMRSVSAMFSTGMPSKDVVSTRAMSSLVLLAKKDCMAGRPDTLKLNFWSTLNKSFVGGDWLMKGPSKSDAAHSWMCSTAPTEHTELCRTSLPSIWTQRGIC